MDDFFNHDVASWLYNSVSKMDDAEAEMFTRFTVYEVHKADIENNRRTLDRHTEEIHKSILSALHPEIREMVAKAWEADTPWEELYGKPQQRDKAGRWTKIGFSGPSVTFERRKTKAGKERKDFDLTSALNHSGQAGSAFSERWTARGPNDHSTNERTYRRIQAGAQLLEHVPNKNVKAAAQLGQFAGQFGPEAEKVIGPAARRTAYRYRGTERQPDRDLAALHQVAMRDQKKLLHTDEELKRGVAETPELRMAAAEQAAARYLYNRLPKKHLSTLQRESGKLPPSEGIIISPDGQIVTQAVGYMEDHYLPFNLKNLKGLQGGAYVRTRSTGGLTSEDIYTGLIAGARSVTVVSRSGVFTLDFEDDLRGGRRYSDKARQMVGRYAQTLDAVQSEKVNRRGLTPDERAEIRDEVEAELEGMGYKSAEIEAKIKEREKEYASAPKLTKSELDEINAKAQEAADSYTGARSQGTERVPSDPKKRFSYYRSEFMDAAMEDKAKRNYQLDADGYEAAMEALKEQFPYFVANVQVRKLPRGTEKDSGYVRPNYNRPKAVQAGYFDTDINGKGKFSAAQLHYQNYSRSGDRDGAGAGEAGEAAEERKLKATRVNVNEIRANEQVKARRAAAVSAAADAASAFAEPKEHPTLTKYRANPDISTFSPKEIDALVEDLNKIKPVLLMDENRSKFPGEAQRFSDAMVQVDRTNAQIASRVTFKAEDWNPSTVSAVPQKWSNDPEHTPGQEPVVYARAFAKVASEARLLKDGVSADTTDEQLKALQRKYSDVYEAADALSKDIGSAAALEKTLAALVRMGATEAQIAGVERDFDEKVVTGSERLAEEAKKKALGIIQLRSILAAGGDAVVPEPAKAAESTAVATTTAATTKNKSFHLQLEDMAESGIYGDEVALKLRDLAVAVESKDFETADEIMEGIPENLRALFKRALDDERGRGRGVR